ncbi:MAG: hypothetical protein ACQETH_10365 [Candidatus Rifleibacteriota bacterium]
MDNPPAALPPGLPSNNKPSEKHGCFSEGLLLLGTLAEKDFKISSVPSDLSVFKILYLTERSNTRTFGKQLIKFDRE